MKSSLHVYPHNGAVTSTRRSTLTDECNANRLSRIVGCGRSSRRMPHHQHDVYDNNSQSRVAQQTDYALFPYESAVFGRLTRQASDVLDRRILTDVDAEPNSGSAASILRVPGYIAANLHLTPA